MGQSTAGTQNYCTKKGGAPMVLIGLGLVAIIVGALVTLVVITIVGAERKLRKARRESEGEK